MKKSVFPIIKIIILTIAIIIAAFLLLRGEETKGADSGRGPGLSPGISFRCPRPGLETTGEDYPLKPVPFTQVHVDDVFWAPKMETNRTVTVPFALDKNEETGRVDNFRKAAGLMKGAFQGKRYNDSDIFKVMEGAAYTLMLHSDPGLKKRLDDLIVIIGKAQEADGYIYTNRTIDPKNPAPGAGKERWSNLRVSHEFYNVGHMYEASAAHFLATGERGFLDIAIKNADLLVRTFGPGKKRAFPGHQEIEIGLAKLYRATGKRAYLDLAKFFLDERGHYFGGERHAPGDPFAVYDSEARIIRFYRREYDILEAQKKIRQEKLPFALAERLSLGI